MTSFEVTCVLRVTSTSMPALGHQNLSSPALAFEGVSLGDILGLWSSRQMPFEGHTPALELLVLPLDLWLWGQLPFMVFRVMHQS